jgi:hypothetical protein
MEHQMSNFDPARVQAALRVFRAWLTNGGYRPERRYMRSTGSHAAKPPVNVSCRDTDLRRA